jgi:hypothetical protein
MCLSNVQTKNKIYFLLWKELSLYHSSFYTGLSRSFPEMEMKSEERLELEIGLEAIN